VATLRGELARALRAPIVAHVLSVPVRAVRPRVTTAMLAARHPAYIVIDRPTFTLRLYQHLRLTLTRSPWGWLASSPRRATPHPRQAGQPLLVRAAFGVGGEPRRQGDPARPPGSAGRALDGDRRSRDGIYGTNEPWSIGSAASHGCIRMLVPDVIQLYSLTPLGSPVCVI
jgi:hypothetical protein